MVEGWEKNQKKLMQEKKEEKKKLCNEEGREIQTVHTATNSCINEWHKKKNLQAKNNPSLVTFLKVYLLRTEMCDLAYNLLVAPIAQQAFLCMPLMPNLKEITYWLNMRVL